MALRDKDADKYFLPFKLAIDCRKSNLRILHAALDATQRMIAYGYLSGEMAADPSVYPPSAASESKTSKSGGAGEKKGAPPRRPRKVIDVLVETIYQCCSIDDDQVQIQVIKTLITAVQSKSCNVHDHSVLLAVRSCYQIYLTSRSSANRTTAKAILTQMLNVVFEKMEDYAKLLQDFKRANPSVGNSQARAVNGAAVVKSDSKAAVNGVATPTPEASRAEREEDVSTSAQGDAAEAGSKKARAPSDKAASDKAAQRKRLGTLPRAKLIFLTFYFVAHHGRARP